MIKINLAKKTKSKKAAGGTGGFDLSMISDLLKLGNKGGGGGASEGGTDWKNSPVAKAIVIVAILFFVRSYLDDERKTEVSKLNGQIQAVEKQVADVQGRLSQVRGFEDMKRQLDQNEQTVRTKLDVITKLIDNRDAPVRLMMHIAQNIPSEVWLTDFQINGPTVRFIGGTMGYNQVSDFIRTLTDSALFDDINLSGIQESTSSGSTAGSEIKFQQFEITARRRNLI